MYTPQSAASEAICKRRHIDVDGKATSSTEILEFARGHPQLINVKEERLAETAGTFYSLNYTEKANSAAAADWHPITMKCRGLVICEPLDEAPYFVVVPCPKFFNWPRDMELPEEVTFMRKVDGSCIHASVMAVPELRWVVGTRSSLHSPQAVLAASLLPSPNVEHLRLTLMMELIDPESDPHGETAAATGPTGLRLLAAWRNDLKLPFEQLDGVVSLLGANVSLVPQEVKSRSQFLAAFQEIEDATTRDDVREGWVVEDGQGVLHKYKSKTWLRWSKVPMVNDRNMFKVLKEMLGLKKRCPQTPRSVNDYVLQQFPHLVDKSFKESPELVISELAQLEKMTSSILAVAETAWEARLLAIAAPLEAAAGGLDKRLERKDAFRTEGAKPFLSVAFARGEPLTVAEALHAAKEDHSCQDSLALLMAGSRK